MALKSAQMAGLEVPDEDARQGRRLARPGPGRRTAPATSTTRYAADTPEQRRGREPNLAMTAEALLMRMYLGCERDDPAMVAGADYLKANLPEVGTASAPLRDAYYWYYATQVMFQMQGDYWNAWNDRLRPAAGDEPGARRPAGRKLAPRPRRMPDRWGHAGGRLYVTAMNLLMLEVYYRHLPLFQTLE